MVQVAFPQQTPATLQLIPPPTFRRENNCLDAADPGDRGQPGFTCNEQCRFADIAASGGLTDAYRLLHPSAAWQECVTWRGAAGKDVAESGRYYNKGMRIDLFMIQASLRELVDEVEVCGRGANMDGFLGSDHSPLVLRLLDSPRAARCGGADNAARTTPAAAEATEPSN